MSERGAIVVTGATTPLGRGLVEQLLLEPGPEIIAVARDGERRLLPDSERVHYVPADLTRERDIKRMLFGVAQREQATVLVHLAFHRSLRAEGRRAHQLNVDSTRLLLRFSEKHPSLRRFIYPSSADVYHISPGGAQLLDESAALELDPSAPQRVRDRIEADLAVCTRMGMSELDIQVLRLADVVAPDVGSQLFDYLQTKVCMRPLGYDPVLNLLSEEDAVRALLLATRSRRSGLFNIPGADTLPLSKAIERAGRVEVPVPGFVLNPAYQLRASTLGLEFSYDANHRRFHFSALLDGRRAADELGYRPTHPLDWKRLGPGTRLFDTRAARA